MIAEENTLWKIFCSTAAKYPRNAAIRDSPTDLSYVQLIRAVESFVYSTGLGNARNPFIVSLLPAGAKYIVSSLATLSVSKIVVVIHDTYTSTQVEQCLKTLNYPPVITTSEKWDSLNTVFGLAYPQIYFMPDKFDINSRGVTQKGSKNCARENEAVSEDESSNELAVHDVGLEGVAYCLFTSGSTGTPKAVLVRDSSVVNGAEALVATSPSTFTPYVRGLMGVPVSFIPSLSDIWTIFKSGGTLIVPPPNVKLNIDAYRKWITDQHITAATFATPVMEMLLAKDVDKLTSLRWVTFGGARMNPGRIHMEYANFTAYHIYGSTEIFSGAICKIPKGCENVTTSVGKPIKNAKFYIVNDKGEEVKDPDIRGDIYVAGAGIMKGYYGQPTLTESVLIQNPFDPNLSPVFITGDIGYWGQDGKLYVSGRKDEQVKVHGMRLELGEIEATLCCFPGIRQAIAIAYDHNENGENVQIYAYCTLDDIRTEPSLDILNEFLVHRIQRHAIPRTITFLEEFPKTSSGKIDRLGLKKFLKASMEPLYANQASDEDSEISDWVKLVRSVWAEVLKIEPFQIRPSDNFFYLGGNSVLTFSVIERLKIMEPKLAEPSPFLLFRVPVLMDFAQALQLDANENEFALRPSDIDFDAEIQLPRDFPSRCAQGAILVTGATGFLGKLLLMDILKKYSDAEVYAVVRAEDDDKARRRLVGILDPKHLVGFKRVKVLAGDLAKFKFALNDDVYEQLLYKVNTVFHSAADVSFMKTYEQLRESTIEMTKNVLRFAMEGLPKKFHFMSTIGVFDGVQDLSPNNFIAAEDRIPAAVQPSKMVNAYFQSKWVSEQLVWAAAKRGLCASIYRIAQVGAHSLTKSVNRSDAIAGFIIACKKLCRYPLASMKLPYVDGDVADKIVTLSKVPSEQNADPSVFHLVGKEAGFEDFFESAEGMQGITLEEWEIEFQKSVAPAPNTEDEINAWLFLQMFKQAEERALSGEKSLMKNISFSTTKTTTLLESPIPAVHCQLYADLLTA